MSRPIFVGLDIETTGSKPVEQYQVIQIGAHRPGWARFVRDIGYETWNEDPEAMAVNKFTAERIRAGRPIAEVDRDLKLWLLDRSFRENEVIPVGWNVGTFDMPYVRRYLPKSARFFSYRSVDLNAVCFTLAEATGRDWETLKRQAKAYAAGIVAGVPHDAGYDAEAAMTEWHYLQQIAVRATP
jgi:DNA polymerase III epsilon subunit-like protein